MTSPAEELRAAAKLLRKRGKEATPGPWERPLNTRYKHVVTAAKPDDEQGRYLDGRPERVGVVQLNIWSDGTHMRKRGGRDLEWIALMSPAAAEPLAAWLDGVAKDLDGHDPHGGCECTESDSYHRAMDFAAAILGRTS